MTEPMQAADAEGYLIGAVLSGYNDVDSLAELVTPGDFYSPLNEEIWSAVLRVHGAGNRPDVLAVRLALGAAQVRHDPTVLIDLSQSTPLVSQAPYYAEMVADAAGRRRLQAAGIKITQLGSSQGNDLEEVREEARAAVDEATEGRSLNLARTIADLLPSVIDIAQNGQTVVLSSGWPDLDRLIGGLAPGRLIIVGARPGVGKSVMGTNLALHMAHHHQHAVLLASMEMPEDEVGQRLLAAHAGVNLTNLQNGATDERSWRLIADRTESLTAMPITIDDAPGQTVTAIRRAARNVQRNRDDLALIVVDYLQLITVPDSRKNRSEALGEVSRGLKLLARETGACVVAMAQVNREAVKHSDGRPKMSDLRESGSIEADADQVLLLHQPDEEAPDIEVVVDKNRHGPKGIATLEMQGHYARLVSRQWSPSTRALA